MNILNSIKSGLVALTLAISSMVGIPFHTEAPAQNLGAFNTTAGGTYRLQSSVGSTDTTIRLSSFKEPISNSPYTMALLNSSIAYGTIDPQNPTRTEIISFTGITQNSDGTASLTGVTRGLSRSYPYTASSTFRVAHAGQSIFILSDAPQIFNQYTSSANDSVITGSWSFPTPTTASNPVTLGYATSTFVDFASNQTVTGNKTFTGASTLSGTNTFSGLTSISNGNTATFNGLVSLLGGLISASTTFTTPPTSATSPTNNTEVANKAYVDGVAIAGAPISNNTTTGIGRTASSTQISSGYSSTTPYFIPSSLASSTASTTANIVVVASTSGYIDYSFFNQSYGDGSDGDVTISATTTLTSDKYYNNLTVNAPLLANGWRVFVAGTLSGTSSISFNGANGNSGSVVAGGAGGAATTTGWFMTYAGTAGGNGGNGSNGANGTSQTATTSCLNSSASQIGGTGGNGAGYTGGAGGATTTCSSVLNKFGVFSYLTYFGLDQATSTSVVRVKPAIGGTGGGGGGATALVGGGGGGGGAGGGLLMVFAKKITSSISFSANGGNGGRGSDAAGGWNGGGGGGGAGGNGGYVLIVSSDTSTWTGTSTTSGGTGGIGGTQSGGTNGTNGSNGISGTSKIIYPFFSQF